MIRIEDLHKRYMRVEALHGLTLDVPEGSIFALTGPNGAGKSTTIRILMNLLRPSRGRAEVMGVDSRRLGARELQHIGYVSEAQRLPGFMTAETFFRYLAPFYPAWDMAEAIRLAAEWHLPLDRRIGAMSRGMRLKVALASSVAYRPRLLVLDEPFSGLDVLVREQLIEAVLERASEMTVLIASHDLAELESFASDVAYMSEGRLVFAQEMSSLLERFRRVEVTLPEAGDLPPDLPVAWLRLQCSGSLLRFTDSQFDAARTSERIRAFWPDTSDMRFEPVGLREIFVSIAAEQTLRRAA